jgi:hypothetical protein
MSELNYPLGRRAKRLLPQPGLAEAKASAGAAAIYLAASRTLPVCQSRRNLNVVRGPSSRSLTAVRTLSSSIVWQGTFE